MTDNRNFEINDLTIMNVRDRTPEGPGGVLYSTTLKKNFNANFYIGGQRKLLQPNFVP